MHKEYIMSFCKKAALAAGLSLVALTAFAQDIAMPSPVAVASSDHQSPWMVRVRSIWVNPEVSSTYLTSGLGVEVTDVSNDWAPEVDFNYFFNPHVSAELIFATTESNVTGTGNLDLGTVKLLPPTVTALYHFTPDALFSPYAGAGLNYTFFYDAQPGDVNDIQYDNTFGLAVQLGMDVRVNDTWSVNFDVKKIFLNTEVHVNDTGNMDDSLQVTLNPWIFGVGAGYKF
jgi:outer membrane protein